MRFIATLPKSSKDRQNLHRTEMLQKAEDDLDACLKKNVSQSFDISPLSVSRKSYWSLFRVRLTLVGDAISRNGVPHFFSLGRGGGVVQ